MSVKIVAFSASPRPRANSSIMLDSFLEGSLSVDPNVVIDVIRTEEADILPCRGCLRCNLLKHCIVRKDGWPELSRKILEADVLVFATPIYFHHTTGSCKKILDRFRSFVHVQITEEGLIHTPHQKWQKQFILLSALGSSSDKDAQPLKDLLSSITEMLGEGNQLHSLTGTRLAMGGQISFGSEMLADLYGKLGLPVRLAAEDAEKNAALLERAGALGMECAESVQRL
jgi:multimeric flavodoxin WrbA